MAKKKKTMKTYVVDLELRAGIDLIYVKALTKPEAKQKAFERLKRKLKKTDFDITAEHVE